MTFKFGKLALDPVDIGSRGNAILGIRDSGKTYTATCIAEHLFDAGIPFIAFDPIGVWRFLRVPGAARGYPVVVAGGEQPDLPLTVAGAPALVHAAMANGVSLVIDLFDINLSKADWKRIVTACLRTLLHENARHGLRHVFIEEAAEFCPQRVGPDQGQVYAEIEKLARMGGNARLGYTLINQRAEEVNKAVLELCDNLFLHRQKGRNSLTALSKWLDIGAVKDHRDIVDSLSTLPTGECWAWLGGTENAVRVTVPAKHSLHPDRRVMRGAADREAKPAVNVSTFVETMRGTLQAVEAEAKANDAAELKKRISALELELAAAKRSVPAPERVEVPVIADDRVRQFSDLVQVLEETGRRILAKADEFRADLQKVAQARLAPRPAAAATSPRSRVGQSVAATPAPPPPKIVIPDAIGNGRVSGVQQRVLNALAELEQIGANEPDRELVAFMAGYSNVTSKGFANAIGGLRTAAYVTYPGNGTIALSDLGRDHARPPTAPRSASEVQERVIGMLGGASGRILRPLIDAYPDAMPRQDLAEAAGYGNVTSKGFANAIGRLRSLGFIDYPDRGTVAAKPVLFLEAGR